MRKYEYGFHCYIGALDVAIDSINQDHPEWDVISIEEVYRARGYLNRMITNVVYRIPLPTKRTDPKGKTLFEYSQVIQKLAYVIFHNSIQSSEPLAGYADAEKLIKRVDKMVGTNWRKP